MQIIVPQFDLLAEDMSEKVVDVRKDAIGGLKGNRLVTVQETVDLPAVVRVVACSKYISKKKCNNNI